MPDMHSLFLFEHKFDEFLFTPIGEEENGMVLNVLSAFARRNVDPWEEAARLSRLPRDVATRELCAMIAELASGAAPPLRIISWTICREPSPTAWVLAISRNSPG